MSVTAFNRTICPNGRAGVAAIWLIDEADVTDLTFDADYQVSAITLAATKFWHKITFDKDSAFLDQPKTNVTRYSKNVVQTLQFSQSAWDTQVLKWISDLQDCCGIHAIVKTNSGQLVYCGISYDTVADTWESEQMITGDGLANTGTDPTSDSNILNESLTCNSNFYARILGIAESAIVVS